MLISLASSGVYFFLHIYIFNLVLVVFYFFFVVAFLAFFLGVPRNVVCFPVLFFPASLGSRFAQVGCLDQSVALMALRDLLEPEGEGVQD